MNDAPISMKWGSSGSRKLVLKFQTTGLTFRHIENYISYKIYFESFLKSFQSLSMDM